MKCARCVAVLAGLGIAFAIQAQEVRVFPWQYCPQVVETKQATVTDRLYPQGALQKISGRVRIEAQIHASGAWSSLTCQLPDQQEALPTFNASLNSLQQMGALLLFWCEGRDCGSSNLWANTIFNQSLLYGLDNQQAYLLARLPNTETLLSLYAVTRGTGQAFLQAETLQSSQALGALLPTPATLLRQLRLTGQLDWPTLSDDAKLHWLPLLVRLLRLDSTLRVQLNGPSAEAWRDALIQTGVQPSRLESNGSEAQSLHILPLR